MGEMTKRFIAAEWSRELGVKILAGNCRIASLGYPVSAPLTFGLRREMVDEKLCSKGVLAKGQYKALQSDRVRIGLGSNEELAVVKWIFEQFVVERRTDVDIARQLNRAKIASQHGRPWTYTMVHNILRNENYVGNLTYNKTSRRLAQTQTNNPEHMWVRSVGVVPPVLDRDTFLRAQTIMAGRYIDP